jgi:hypothetical protein
LVSLPKFIVVEHLDIRAVGVTVLDVGLGPVALAMQEE